VQPVTGALDKITRLQGVTYDWRRDEFPDKNFDAGSQLGFLAQSVEKVVPEAVRTDADGYKAVAYEKLTAVLTEGVKEQQSEIEALKTRNAALEKNMAELKALVEKLLQK
jgi:trimeric autotransporter adhesin